jgi:hypothetical protein
MPFRVVFGVFFRVFASGFRLRPLLSVFLAGGCDISPENRAFAALWHDGCAGAILARLVVKIVRSKSEAEKQGSWLP